MLKEEEFSLKQVLECPPQIGFLPIFQKRESSLTTLKRRPTFGVMKDRYLRSSRRCASLAHLDICSTRSNQKA